MLREVLKHLFKAQLHIQVPPRELIRVIRYDSSLCNPLNLLRLILIIQLHPQLVLIILQQSEVLLLKEVVITLQSQILRLRFLTLRNVFVQLIDPRELSKSGLLPFLVISWKELFGLLIV